MSGFFFKKFFLFGAFASVLAIAVLAFAWFFWIPEKFQSQCFQVLNDAKVLVQKCTLSGSVFEPAMVATGVKVSPESIGLQKEQNKLSAEEVTLVWHEGVWFQALFGQVSLRDVKRFEVPSLQLELDSIATGFVRIDIENQSLKPDSSGKSIFRVSLDALRLDVLGQKVPSFFRKEKGVPLQLAFSVDPETKEKLSLFNGKLMHPSFLINWSFETNRPNVKNRVAGSSLFDFSAEVAVNGEGSASQNSDAFPLRVQCTGLAANSESKGSDAKLNSLGCSGEFQNFLLRGVPKIPAELSRVSVSGDFKVSRNMKADNQSLKLKFALIKGEIPTQKMRAQLKTKLKELIPDQGVQGLVDSLLGPQSPHNALIQKFFPHPYRINGGHGSFEVESVVSSGQLIQHQSQLSLKSDTLSVEEQHKQSQGSVKITELSSKEFLSLGMKVSDLKTQPEFYITEKEKNRLVNRFLKKATGNKDQVEITLPSKGEMKNIEKAGKKWLDSMMGKGKKDATPEEKKKAEEERRESEKTLRDAWKKLMGK